MVNKVILVGNLGRDPEARDKVTTFTLATERRWQGRDGQSGKETEWHNVVCFGRQAEVAAKHLAKGNRIYVEGRLHTSSWDDRESGQKRYKTEIICERMQMLGGATPAREERVNGDAAPAYDYASAPKPRPGTQDDDIPF